MTYQGSGNISIGGCAIYNYSIFNYLPFGPGDTLYLYNKALKGKLEKVTIKRVHLAGTPSNYPSYTPLYLDNLNCYYNQDELCPESEAISLAIAYYTNRLNEITELLGTC